jgi:uncharacterized protein
MNDSPLIFDHAFVVALGVLFPVYGHFEFKRLKARVEAGDRAALRREYLETMAWLWGFTALAVAAWLVLSRPVATLGIRWETPGGFWISAVVVALVLGFFFWQWQAVRTNRELHPEALEALQFVRQLLPATVREVRLFSAVSVTAGVCEELLFRGYLIWYLTDPVGLPGAVLISSALFGFGHLYQGVGGMVKTGVAGLLAAGIYLLSGSIWIPMVLHAGIDILQGLTAYAVLSDSPK